MNEQQSIAESTNAELSKTVTELSNSQSSLADASATVREQKERLSEAGKWAEMFKDQQKINSELQSETVLLTRQVGELTGELKALKNA